MNYKQRKITERAENIKMWFNNKIPWKYCKLYARSNAIDNFLHIGNEIK